MARPWLVEVMLAHARLVPRPRSLLWEGYWRSNQEAKAQELSWSGFSPLTAEARLTLVFAGSDATAQSRGGETKRLPEVELHIDERAPEAMFQGNVIGGVG